MTSNIPDLPEKNQPQEIFLQKDAFLSIVIGALIVFTLSLIPFFDFCCVHLILGPLATVAHFTRVHKLSIPKGIGAKFGMMSVFLGSLLNVVVGLIIEIFFPESKNSSSKEIMESLESYEQYFELLLPALEKMDNLSIENILLSLFGVVFVSLFFGSLGGALGASLFKRQN